MRKSTKLFSVIVFVIMTLCAGRADASHFKGGDIYFECLGNGVYQLVFACYYACEPTSTSPYPPADISWTLTSTCGTVPTALTAISESTPVDVPFYCPGVLTDCDYGFPYSLAPPGAPTGTLVVIYTSDTFSIPAGCTVAAEMDVNARNAAVTNLVNPSIYDIDIAATITGFSAGTCNYNPIFAQYPVNVFCQGQNANFSQGAIDLNGDSLVYTLINPRTAGGAPIPFVAGCTPTNPLGAPSVFASVWSFDTHTGNINFTPTATGDYVLTVQVNAYHNGVLTGSTMRDIQFTVVACTTIHPAPDLTNLFSAANVVGGTVIDSTHISVCLGTPLQITLISTTADSNTIVVDSSNAATSLPGSTVTMTSTFVHFDTLTMQINWTPGIADSGFHYLTLTVRDTFCPMPGRQTYTFVISVLRGVYAGPNQVYCNGGAPVTIYATGSDHYVWTDSATGGAPVGVISYGPDSSYIVVDPAHTTSYIVHGDLPGSCKNIDTVTIINAPLFSLSTMAADTSICKYTTTTLTTTPTPSNVGPFTYSWSLPGSVVSPHSASTQTTPLLLPTWYYVSVTAAGGCLIHDSVQVHIAGAAPRISITPSANNVCPGDTITLFGNVVAEDLVYCGPVDSCVNNPVYSLATVGPTNTSTGSGGFTNIYDVSPFSGSENIFKVQYLFRASELNAMGLSSGTFTNLAFFVNGITATYPFDTFTISMGCSGLDSLTDFVGGLSQVYYTNSLVPTMGWNNFLFPNTFYGWDGSSSIVVQVCYTINPAFFSNDDFVAYTTTSYTGSTYYEVGFTGNGCTLTSASGFGGAVNQRPTIQFGMCAPNIVHYQWTPLTLGCDTCQNTTVIVSSDSTYTLTASDNNCTNDSTVRVLINTNLGITVTPADTTFCNGADTVQLHVALTNPPTSECVQGYSLASVPYNPLSGSATTIDGFNDYFDAFGFNTDGYDGTAGPYNIGFTFPFYCQSYSNVYINTNGWFSFINPYPMINAANEYTAEYFPPTAPYFDPMKMVAFIYNNWVVYPSSFATNAAVSYFLTGVAPNQTFVVVFTNIEDANTGLYHASGQVQLHQNGVIDILITSDDYVGSACTMGIKDSTGLGIAPPTRDLTSFTISTPEQWEFTPQFGPSTVLTGNVWSPNTNLSSDTISNPLAYPTSTTVYTVQSSILINQFTSHPEVCIVHDSARIGVSPPFTGTVTAVPQLICPGDSSQLTFTPANPGTTYVWGPTNAVTSTSISNPFATVLDTTAIYLTATNGTGCVFRDTVTINTYPVQHPSIGANHIICFDDSVQLSLAGTYTNYQWYLMDTLTGTRTQITGATSSSLYGYPDNFYILKVAAAGSSCSYFTNVVQVDSFSRVYGQVVASGPLTFCIGSSVVLQVSLGVDTSTIVWTPSSFGNRTAFAVDSPGIFSYVARDANNCPVTSNVDTVTVIPAPAITITAPRAVICDPGGSDTLTAAVTPAGSALVWDNSTGTQVATGAVLIISTPDVYEVHATATVGGCVDSMSFSLGGAVSPLVVSPVIPPSCNCNPNTVVAPIVVPQDSPYTYIWSNGSTGSTVTDDSLGSQTYSMTVTDANGCTAMMAPLTVQITCPSVSITVNPVNDTIFISDSSATLTAVPGPGVNIGSYQWFPAAYVTSQGLDSTHIIAQHPGIDTFWLVVTGAGDSSCTNTVYQYVNVVSFGSFTMGTAFTPNGDGVNDFFYPVLNGPSSPSKVLDFRIYSRWGQLVYNNPNTPGWDGNFDGAAQPSDVYMYYVTVQYPDPADAAKTIQKSVEGSLQLFR